MTPDQWDRVEWAANEIIGHAIDLAVCVFLSAVVLMLAFVTGCKLGLIQ